MRIQTFLFALVIPMTGMAEKLNTPEQTLAVCTQIATFFSAGDYDGAYEGLIGYWPLPKEEIQNLGYQTKSQLSMLGDRFGASIGAEHVRTIEAGKSLVRHIFLIKYEKHALRFSCVFYKPKDKWMINSVLWDDRPQDLLSIGDYD